MTDKQNQMRELLLETWEYVPKNDAIKYLITIYGEYEGYQDDMEIVYDSIAEYRDGFVVDDSETN